MRDSRGEVKSSLLKIRHYGYANCVNPNPVIAEQPGTGGGSVNTGGCGGSSSGGSTTGGGSGSNTTPSLGSATPGVNGACNPPGTTLVEVKTDLPQKSFQRADYANVVTPLTVYAFSFRTPDTTEPYIGQLVATQLSLWLHVFQMIR